MPTWPWIIAVVGAGLIVGATCRRRLLRGGYRYPDETEVLPTFPWVPIATAVAWGYVTLSARRHPWYVVVGLLAAVTVLVVLSAIDLDVHRLPDRIVLPCYPATAAMATLWSTLSGDWAALVRSVLAAVAGYFIFLILGLIGPQGGLGFGDVKLAGVLGGLLGWFGWTVPIAALYATFIVGGLRAVWLLLVRGADRKASMAFGPFMAVGTILAIALV